ncbi:hypothetical protein [Chryseobacterium sp. 2R14A]|uniref:hypothetical protein n=1 Tax=Chryseobacterium sp. 2R14A TaxID=3380353 RepID=UPI003CF1284E
MNKIQKLGCICEKPEFHHTDYRESLIGVDKTNGRYADVSLLQCKLCQRIWIKYLVEFESFSKSGRWYRGIISKKEANVMPPENAVEYLENVDWYIFGGSYFESTGTFGQGKLNVDL